MAGPADDIILENVTVTGQYTGPAAPIVQPTGGQRRRFVYVSAPRRGPRPINPDTLPKGDVGDIWNPPPPERPPPLTPPKDPTPEDGGITDQDAEQIERERKEWESRQPPVHDAYAPPTPEVLPELPRVTVTPKPTPLNPFAPLAPLGRVAARGVGWLFLLLTPMAAGGRRTGELRDPIPPARPPKRPVSPEDVPYPDWRFDPLDDQPLTPRQPVVPDIELDPVTVTGRRVRVPQLPNVWEPYLEPRRAPLPRNRPSPRRSPQPDGAPGSEPAPRRADPAPAPVFGPAFDFPFDPAPAPPRPGPATRPGDRTAPAPGTPTSRPGPTDPAPHTPTASPDVDLEPLTSFGPDIPNEADQCSCEKPKKKRKKTGDRTECFQYTVRQLRRGQITFSKKLVACETRDDYKAAKKPAKKPRGRKPKPGTNPFPGLPQLNWSI